MKSKLSPREQQVIKLLVAGKTQKEAAAHLGISASTIRVHLQRARAKFGARSLLEMVIRASRYSDTISTT